MRIYLELLEIGIPGKTRFGCKIAYSGLADLEEDQFYTDDPINGFDDSHYRVWHEGEEKGEGYYWYSTPLEAVGRKYKMVIEKVDNKTWFELKEKTGYKG